MESDVCTRILTSLFVAVVALSLGASVASAQVLGTFRWRTEPYCNVLNLTVTQSGNVFTLDGFDEPCGGNPRLPVHGVAVPQTNGTITLGLSIINVPGGAPVNIEAGINLPTASGTWRDSAGQSGPFTLNPSGPTGSPRPLQVATAAAWGVVNGFNPSFTAKSADVASVTRVNGVPAGGWCIMFTHPISLERRGAAVAGSTTGSLVILGNATTNAENFCPGGLYIFAVAANGAGFFDTIFNFIVP